MAAKREETVLSEFWEDVDNSPSRVPERDGYPSHSGTPHRPTVRPHPSQSGTLSYKETTKDHPGDHNPPEAGGEIPGRFELGVARRDGTLGEVLQKIEDAAQETKRSEQKSIVALAMEAACTENVEDRKTFSRIMLYRNPDICREVIYRFDSERRAGEFGGIRNLPALLTKRLSALPVRTA